MTDCCTTHLVHQQNSDGALRPPRCHARSNGTRFCLCGRCSAAGRQVKVVLRSHLGRTHMRGQSLPGSEIVSPIAIDKAHHDLGCFCCDKTGEKTLPFQRLNIEGHD